MATETCRWQDVNMIQFHQKPWEVIETVSGTLYAVKEKQAGSQY
jgi:hypothetical protein